MSRAARITDVIAYHGEGAFWDEAQGRLLLVDMLAGDVLALADGAVERRHLGDVAAAVRRRERGGYLVARERDVVLTDADWQVEASIPVLSGAGVRLNEGGCDPAGRFYIGSMAYDTAPGAGTLFRIDPDRTVSTVLTAVTVSNGIQWSADGATAFYNDTATGRVDAFDAERDGELSGRRPFAEIDPPGAPDGSAIDREGGLWVALWDGGGVLRLDSAGKVSEVVELPVPRVTSCAFGGDDRTTLFITTSREDMPADDTVSGSVFAYEAGVAGAPVHPYRG